MIHWMFRGLFSGGRFLLLVALVVLRPTQAQAPSQAPAKAPEEVDFGLAPGPGLQFQLVETETLERKGKQIIGRDELTVDFTARATRKNVFTQTIQKVENNQIVELERAYEDVRQKTTARTGNDEPAAEKIYDDPLAWKRLRATWTDGKLSIKVRADDAWKNPDEAIRARLSSSRLRQPVFPFPPETRKVGDTWEMDGRQIRDYFVEAAEPVAGRRIEIEGSARFQFKQFAEVNGVRCAEIHFQTEITLKFSDRLKPQISTTGTLYYSIPHRILFGLKAEGTMNSRGELDQQGKTISVQSRGTVRTEIQVKVLQEARIEKP